jgi:hypothetical protein
MTMQEVVPEPELTDIRSRPLGVSAVRQEKLLDKSGDDPEGIIGVLGGIRKTSEEMVMPVIQESICASPGVVEITTLEEQFHGVGEAGIEGEYQMGSILSVGIGEERDEGDQGSESPTEAEIDLGVFGLGGIESLNVRKGLNVQENIGYVSEIVECERELKGYVGCEDDLRGGGEGDNSLALVIRTENVIGGSGIMDIQPLMML